MVSCHVSCSLSSGSVWTMFWLYSRLLCQQLPRAGIGNRKGNLPAPPPHVIMSVKVIKPPLKIWPRPFFRVSVFRHAVLICSTQCGRRSGKDVAGGGLPLIKALRRHFPERMKKLTGHLAPPEYACKSGRFPPLPPTQYFSPVSEHKVWAQR
jgi:hypothetical protein